MSREIWKYPFDGRPGALEILMPVGAQVVHVAVQHETPTLWAMADTEAQRQPRRFVIVGTGWEIPVDTLVYRGTWHEGPYVWHLLEDVA